MNPRHLIIPAAILTALAIPGAASANNNTVTADCAGLAFNMARGEEGTVVTTTLDGRTVRTDTVAAHGDPLAFTIASPDQTTSHTWTVLVDSAFNDDKRTAITVEPCVQATTTTVPPVVDPTTTTTVPPVVDPTTTTTVPPRVDDTTTVPTTPTESTIVKVGAPSSSRPISIAALAALVAGFALIGITRRGAR